MHDDELRALIREAIARHLFDDGRGLQDGTGLQDGRGSQDGRGRSPNGPSCAAGSVLDSRSGRPEPRRGAGNPPYRMTEPSSGKTHVSHGRFLFLAPTEPDAPCVVEPNVRCHHCGFCQSYGH